MSASEKLKALDGEDVKILDKAYALVNALPQIVAVVEQVPVLLYWLEQECGGEETPEWFETLRVQFDQDRNLHRGESLVAGLAALAALDEALS